MHKRSTVIGIYLLAALLLAVNVSCFAYAATVEATGLTWEHIGMARFVGGMSGVLVFGLLLYPIGRLADQFD